MGGIQKEISKRVVKIVLKQCPRTERAAIKELKNGDHPCPVCGSTEKLNGSHKMSPVQVDLFKNLVLASTLDPIRGGGSGGDGGTLEEDVQYFSCQKCIAQFDMLESLQKEMSLMEGKVEEILTQLRKTISDRRGLKLPVSNTKPGLVDMTNHSHNSTCSDMDENPSSPKTMTTTEYHDKEEDVDELKPVVLHFRDEGDSREDDAHLGAEESISEEEQCIKTNNLDQQGLQDKPSPKVPNTEQRLNITTHTQSTLFDMEEEEGNPLTWTPMTTEYNVEEEEVDLKPVFLDSHDDLLPDDEDYDNADDTAVGSIYKEQPMTNRDHGDQDQPSSKKARRCKVQATQIIAAIFQNDANVDGDVRNDEYSPKNQSETDSDNTNELQLHSDTPKERYKRPRIPSDPSTKLRKGNDKCICKVCGKQVTAGYHAHHMRRHRSVERVSCETCHKTFSTQRELNAHRRAVHLQQHPHKCKKCGKGFYKPRDLRRHLNTRIPCTELLKKKKFICPICRTGFSSSANLLRHTRQIHNMEETINCPPSKCNKSVFTETNFQRHLKFSHTSMTAENLENQEEEMDLKPVILDFQDEHDDNAHDPLEGVDLISEEQPIHNRDQVDDNPVRTDQGAVVYLQRK